MIIIGAGMAGLLAAAMLRDEVTAVWERGDRLPNNHSALLRFRTSIVGDALGVPFKKVRVLKSVETWKNPIADALSYSLKTNGTAQVRSIISADSSQTEERWIAPDDLINRMGRKVSCPIHFGQYFNEPAVATSPSQGPFISTIPMPTLARMFGYRGLEDEFRWVEGYNIRVHLRRVEAYCTLYVPHPKDEFARVSITGSTMIIECPNCAAPHPDDQKVTNIIGRSIELMGLNLDNILKVEVHKQPYAKILPMDENKRKRFIMHMTEEHGIYSLGRFATWRPGLLLDDVVHDVRIIQRMIGGEQVAYEAKKAE